MGASPIPVTTLKKGSNMESEWQVWTLTDGDELDDLIVVGAESETEARELAKDIVGNARIFVTETD